jgi:hypothetical protein
MLRLVIHYEEVDHGEIKAVADRWCLSVHPKVRVADVELVSNLLPCADGTLPNFHMRGCTRADPSARVDRIAFERVFSAGRPSQIWRPTKRRSHAQACVAEMGWSRWDPSSFSVRGVYRGPISQARGERSRR